MADDTKKEPDKEEIKEEDLDKVSGGAVDAFRSTAGIVSEGPEESIGLTAPKISTNIVSKP